MDKYFATRFLRADMIFGDPHRELAEWLNEMWEKQRYQPVLITPITASMCITIEGFDVVFEKVELNE